MPCYILVALAECSALGCHMKRSFRIKGSVYFYLPNPRHKQLDTCDFLLKNKLKKITAGISGNSWMAVPYAVLILEQKINTFPCHALQIILGDKLWEISKCLLLINTIRRATGAVPSALGKGVLGGAPKHWGGGPVQSCFLCLSGGTRL